MMQNTSSQDIAEIVRTGAPLRRVLEDDGIILNKKGGVEVGLCPFHCEGTGSFTYYDEGDGHAHCYGCGWHGDVITYARKRHNLGFIEAGKWLSERYSFALPLLSRENAEKAQERRTREGRYAAYAEDAHKALLACPEAMEWLRGRGLTDETIRAAKIGLATAGASDPDLQALSGRIIFPYRRSGRIVGFSGREYRDSPDGQKGPKYRHTAGLDPLYNADRLRGKRCVVVEGIVDALLVEQGGLHACAISGTNIKDEWLSLVGKDTELILCLDGDEAGRKGTRKGIPTLIAAGRRVRAASLPEGLDCTLKILD